MKIYGIFGDPLKHTLSPAFQEAGFNALNFPAKYIVLEMSRSVFKKTLKGIKDFSIDGFNLTVPYKQDVIPYLSQISKRAKAIGAVNTVYKRGRRWIGENTDAEGFLISLKEVKFDPKGKKALVLGAGGASRAVIYALLESGVKELVLANRTVANAKKIHRDFKKLFKKASFKIVALKDVDVKIVEDADLIINTTSLGLKKKDKLILPTKFIKKAKTKKKLFVDLIYNPPETPFLKNAAKKGHKTLNGIGMLLHQGVLASQLWTEKKAPIKEMRKALLEAAYGE